MGVRNNPAILSQLDNKQHQIPESQKDYLVEAKPSPYIDGRRESVGSRIPKLAIKRNRKTSFQMQTAKRNARRSDVLTSNLSDDGKYHSDYQGY